MRRCLRVALAPPVGFAERLAGMREKFTEVAAAHPKQSVASEARRNRGVFDVCDKDCARIFR